MEATVTSTQDKVVYWGTGRRKSSIARVRLIPGSGEITVNERTGLDYFNQIPSYIQAIKSPLETLGLENEYDIVVKAHGGGLTGQSDAIKLGVARALCQLSPENRPPLKSEGYLTRDPRAKERKKYGLHKARKAPQYSKR
ncbi:MAG: 30S ribosomal protein S9 [Microcystaceae cyanobacterium]